MKIRAIRLKEVGLFSRPVALEGLSGRLDVLAGPNELGKSTLLRAMRMVLTEKATAKSGAVQALKPYTGGAPLIELEFEAEGTLWRLRKQFLARPGVELEDRGNGRTLKGADADHRVEQLLRAGDDGWLGLLWVDQGTPLAPLTPAKTLSETLARAVEADVATAADGSRLRRVREQVRAALGELVTPGRGQPTGRYMQAIKAHESLQRDGDAALLRRQAAESRLDQLAVLGAEIGAITNPSAAAARETAVEQAEAEWTKAEAAEQQRRAAEQRVAAELSALKLATQEAAAFGQRMSEHATLTRETSADDAQRTETEKAREVAAAELMRLQRTRDDLHKAAADLQRDAKAARAARLADQVRRAQSEVAARDAAARELVFNTATPDLVKTARDTAARARAMGDRMAAAAPTISIAYDAKPSSALTLRGRKLADGERISATEPVEIEIEGVGSVTITPGSSGDHEKLAAELTMARYAAAAALKKIGAKTLAAAETLGEQRQQCERAMAEASARLAVLAPDGIEQLAAQHAQLSAGAEGMPVPLRTPGEIDALLDERADALAACDAAHEKAQQTLARHDQEIAGITARIMQRATRMATLNAELADAETRSVRQQAFAGQRADAEARHAAAVREVSAWMAATVDATRRVTLQRNVLAAKTAVAASNQRLAHLKQEAARIEGALTADRNDDVVAHAAEMAEQLAIAAADRHRMERDVAALKLLDSELTAAESSTRDRLSGPVLARLRPYADLVFPGAELDLDDGLQPAGLSRSGASEAAKTLSGGTQEQIAVLLRLGLARLFADRGSAVPLILDDALVYADDRRIAAMFRALEAASAHHQVIVLTCRETTFKELKGERLMLTRWDAI